MTCHLEGEIEWQATSGLVLSCTWTWALAHASWCCVLVANEGEVSSLSWTPALCSARGLRSTALLPTSPAQGTGDGWESVSSRTRGEWCFYRSFPKCCLFQNTCHSFERHLWPPGKGPTPPVMVRCVKELEGSPVRLHGSQAAPLRGRGEGLELRRGLPIPHVHACPYLLGRRTRVYVCRASQVHACVSTGGTHSVERWRRAWAEGSPHWADLPVGQCHRESKALTLHGARGEAAAQRCAPGPCSGSGSSSERTLPWGYQLLLGGVLWSGNESLLGDFSVQVWTGLEWKFKIMVREYNDCSGSRRKWGSDLILVQVWFDWLHPGNPPTVLSSFWSCWANSNLTKLHYLNPVCCIQPGIKMHAWACIF